MKKFLFLIIAGFFFTLQAMAQSVTIYSMPAFHVQINGTSGFKPTLHSTPSLTESKKVQNVTVAGGTGRGRVWVCSADKQDVLGPYEVLAGETLSVEIDDRDWYVVIESQDDITVDVWVSDYDPGATLPSQTQPVKND